MCDTSKLFNFILVLCCNFDGLIASCRMSVGGVPLEVSARINHCHTPIDVTYVVQSDTKLLQSFDRKGNPEEDESEDDPINITEVCNYLFQRPKRFQTKTRNYNENLHFFCTTCKSKDLRLN